MKETKQEEFFTPKQVMDITGVKYRQLQQWEKNGLVRLSRKRGDYRLYTRRDLVKISIILAMRPQEQESENSYSIQKMRSLLPQIEAVFKTRKNPYIGNYTLGVEFAPKKEHPVIGIGMDLHLEGAKGQRFIYWSSGPLFEAIDRFMAKKASQKTPAAKAA